MLQRLHLSLSRSNQRLPRCEAHPAVVQGTTYFPHDLPDALLPPTAPVFDQATALHTAVHLLDPEPPLVQPLVRHVLLPRQRLAAGFLRRQAELDLGPRAGHTAQVLQEPASRGPGRGGGSGTRLLMEAAAVGVTPKAAAAESIAAQDMFDRVVLGLAALTRRLFRRVLGADAAPCGPVMGTRGEAGAAAGPVAPGASSGARGATRGAASASETPRRGARAVRERAGAAPRARRAVSSAGRRTCIHCLAWPWTIPHKRPCTPWRAEVLR
jgi:hypothetical protein